MKFSEALNEWFEVKQKIDSINYHDMLNFGHIIERKAELEKLMDEMIHEDIDDLR